MAEIVRSYPTCDHYDDGTIRMHCGCRDEPFRGAISFSDPKPMPPKSAFTDNCHYIRHYCDGHWGIRTGDISAFEPPKEGP